MMDCSTPVREDVHHLRTRSEVHTGEETNAKLPLATGTDALRKKVPRVEGGGSFLLLWLKSMNLRREQCKRTIL